jgi:hypothetical protein
MRGKFKDSSKRFFSTTVSKSTSYGGSGLVVATTVTVAVSVDTVRLLGELLAAITMLTLTYAAFEDSNPFIATPTVDERLVLVVMDEERLNYLVNALRVHTNNLQANFYEILSITGNSMGNIRSRALSEYTRNDLNQMVDYYNNLVNYINELRNLTNISVRAVVDLNTMRNAGLNAIQATDLDITSTFDLLYNTGVSLGRDSIHALDGLTSLLTELEGIIYLVAGMVSMGPNPFI